MLVIVPKNNHPPPGRSNGNVIHGWDAQLPTVSQMNGKWNEWNCGHKLADVGCHNL